MSTTVRQLSEILRSEGLVTAEQLESAQREHLAAGRPLGRVLVERGVISESQLVAALARQIGLDFVDLTAARLDPAVVALVDVEVCRRHTVLPLSVADGVLRLAMADPGNTFAVDEVRAVAGLDVDTVVATRDDIRAAIDRLGPVTTDVASIVRIFETEDAGADVPAPRGPRPPVPGRDAAPSVPPVPTASADAPAARPEPAPDPALDRFVTLLLSQAVRDRATDVLVEPGETDQRVRYRIDGVLHEVMSTPQEAGAGLVARFKAMAGLDVDRVRVPQRGRATASVLDREVELAVATLPTVWGERLLLRVLDSRAPVPGLAELGMRDAVAERFRACWSRPHGLVLVSGPAGSGRTTTLHATLVELAREALDVVAVEESVERRLPGVTQVLVSPELPFAEALRSALRAEPDVVLVGELRDRETALAAVEAALTGVLVLASVPGDDAASVPTRLVEMGVEPYLVASSLVAVLGQRLARRLCAACRESYEPSPVDLEQQRFPWLPGEPVPVLHRAAGCAECARTGYAGRVALHELLVVDEEVGRLVADRAAPSRVARAARAGGTVAVRDDGWDRCVQGLTSVDEILRTVS